MAKSPRKRTIIATLCYVMRDGKTLMLYRNKKKDDINAGKHIGVGGKCETGETPYDCVIREVMEEAGIEVDPCYVANLTFTDPKDEADWNVHVFRADGYKGTVRDDCPEGELMWVADKDLPSLNLWPGDSIFMKYLRSRKFFFGRFSYEGGHLTGYRLRFLKSGR